MDEQDCRRVQAALVAVGRGAVRDPEVADHVRRCADCRGAFRAVAIAEAALDEHAGEPEPAQNVPAPAAADATTPTNEPAQTDGDGGPAERGQADATTPTNEPAQTDGDGGPAEREQADATAPTNEPAQTDGDGGPAVGSTPEPFFSIVDPQPVPEATSPGAGAAARSRVPRILLAVGAALVATGLGLTLLTMMVGGSAEHEASPVAPTYEMAVAVDGTFDARKVQEELDQIAEFAMDEEFAIEAPRDEGVAQGGLGLVGTGRGGGGSAEGSPPPGRTTRTRRPEAPSRSAAAPVPASPPAPPSPAAQPPAEPVPIPQPRQGPVVTREQAEVASAFGDATVAGEMEPQEEAEEARDAELDRRRALAPERAARVDANAMDDDASGSGVGAEDLRVARRAPSPEVAAFVAERDRVRGVATRSATGYWYNTYVPGDPRVRELAQAVAGGAAAQAVLGAFARDEHRYDAPSRGALELTVHGDRAGAEGETRMLVEVGLRGSERRGGHRGAMQVIVVLDLGGSLPADAESIVAGLLGGLSRVWDIGDRFGVVVAGRPGGVLVPPGELGWGRAQVASQAAFAAVERGEVLDVIAAWEVAAALLAAEAEAGSLGATMVWLVTPGAAMPNEAAFRARLHAQAVEGITTSVFGMGTNADSALLERLAVAGQGARRRIANADDAPRAVRDEVQAASQVVARAVRLRIRLQPGVRLVGIPGSYPLDEATAQRVREAEQSVDRRVAAALGIAADRGEDEDGVQIVIPAFLAGDAHTILLDVIATRPGPVVDVQVRFKDLVELGNGVLHGSWGTSGWARERGRREWSTWQALLRHRTGDVLADAAARVRNGDRNGAAERLRAQATLVEGLAATLPGWGADASLAQDVAALRWLARDVATGSHDPSYASGIELAARLRHGPLPADLRTRADARTAP